MYFDFEDYHPDISPVGRAISWREGILLSVIVHLAGIIVILLYPRLFPFDPSKARPVVRLAPQSSNPTFVFVQPKLDRKALTAPPNAPPSDMDRQAQAREKPPPKPENQQPFSRGNSPEMVDASPQRQQAARGQGPQPDPQIGDQVKNLQPDASKMPDSQTALTFPSNRTPSQSGANGRSATAGGSLGDALRNLQRYTQGEAFDNPGGAGQFGPEIQFDTKGVEFGPWIRRFIAQVKRNWFIPYAAMSNKGHVVISFNVHKDGSITDLSVVGPSPVDAFNNAAFGALSGSNPTQPLPPEYPTEKAFFTVTFFYNEVPPR